MNDSGLRLMTFNIRHGKGMDGKVNLKRIAEEIKKSRADIIGLQEVDRRQLRSGFKDQVKILADSLGMRWCFSPSLKVGFMEYGNAVLSRYPIVRTRVHYMKGTIERRSVLEAVVRIGNKQVTVVNTHMGFTPSEQSSQFPQLLGIIDSIKGAVVLLGDFNMGMDNLFMQRLARQWRKINLRVKAPTLAGGTEIDHIFTNIPAKESSAWTQPTTASDHHPVIAQIGTEAVASAEHYR